MFRRCAVPRARAAPWLRHVVALIPLAVLLSGMPAGAQETARDSAFVLTARTPEGMLSPFLGNGRLGTRISSRATQAAPAFVAGFYEHAPGDVARIAAIPAWNVIDVFDGAHWLNAGPSNSEVLRGYAQRLDMRTATVRTAYEWIDGDRRTSITASAFVSRADPHVAVMRLVVVPHYAGRLRVTFPLAGWPAPHRLALATVARYDPAWTHEDIWYPGHVQVRSPTAVLTRHGAELSINGSPVGRTTTVVEVAELRWPPALTGARAVATSGGDSALVTLTFDAVRGQSYTFDRVVGIATSLEGRTPATRALHRARLAAARGFNALRADHVAAWARLWQTDIEITGNPSLQRAVRAMLFQLLSSAGSGTSMGIPPMGLSSAGYYGHVFWDSDTWMFPALVLTHPDIARSIVAFRARTVGAARANARANGYAGAMYPWEADENGHEATPRFAGQNASSEIHVTGDVALAAWQYYLATGDSAWLARRGYSVLQATADFWVSRAALDSADGQYHIRNVVSVDEGLVGVSDDAYTNAVARRNLESAVSAARRLGRTPDPAWARVAARLHIAFDSARGTYRTYEGAPDSTLGSVTALLSYPLGMPMAPAVKRANLEYAVRRMLGGRRGAMMGGTLLSVVAAELGDRALVDTLLLPSYSGYLKGPFLLISETPRSQDAVSFVTGAGGFLQQVLFGYTGLRITSHGLAPVFAPVLPSSVTRLVLRHIQARGRTYDVIVDARGRRIVPVGPLEKGATAARGHPGTR